MISSQYCKPRECVFICVVSMRETSSYCSLFRLNKSESSVLRHSLTLSHSYSYTICVYIFIPGKKIMPQATAVCIFVQPFVLFLHHVHHKQCVESGGDSFDERNARPNKMNKITNSTQFFFNFPHRMNCPAFSYTFS